MANNWTYCIYDPDTGQVKWGRSINPFDRVKAFKVERPNCQLVVVLPDHSVEFEMHDRFDTKRQEGEWFVADDEMLAFVEQAKLWTPQPPTVVIRQEPDQPDIQAPAVDEAQVEEPDVEVAEPEQWTVPPKLDLYFGVFLVSASTLMLFLTVLALYWNDWTLDFNTGRWLLSYGPGLVMGIHMIRRNAEKLKEE